MNFKRIARIALRVRDLDESGKFYESVLGGITASGRDNQSTRHRQYWLSLSMDHDDGSFNITLRKGRPSSHIPGAVEFSLQVASPDIVSRTYERAVEHNARAVSPRKVNGRVTTLIFDPDGYRVEVFANRE